MKKLLFIALLFHSSISFSQRTDCKAIYPPPVTTTHKLIDGYLFTYESVDLGDMQPNLCYRNRFYVTDATIPDESESIVDIPMWHERPKLFMAKGDYNLSPEFEHSFIEIDDKGIERHYQIVKSKPRWDYRDEGNTFFIFQTAPTFIHIAGTAMSGYMSDTSVWEKLVDNKITIWGYDYEYKKNGIEVRSSYTDNDVDHCYPDDEPDGFDWSWFFPFSKTDYFYIKNGQLEFERSGQDMQVDCTPTPYKEDLPYYEEVEEMRERLW